MILFDILITFHWVEYDDFFWCLDYIPLGGVRCWGVVTPGPVEAHVIVQLGYLQNVGIKILLFQPFLSLSKLAIRLLYPHLTSIMVIATNHTKPLMSGTSTFLLNWYTLCGWAYHLILRYRYSGQVIHLSQISQSYPTEYFILIIHLQFFRTTDENRKRQM